MGTTMDGSRMPVVETDCLVVGAGPAGGAMGAFLGQNGMKGIVVCSAPGTADTPRAHVVNPFGTECLRDIGLEQDAVSLATTGDIWRAQRWCESMVGKEYGFVKSWGGHGDTRRDTARASPCEWMDLPQTELEPLLVTYLTHHGFDIRFSTELLGVEQAPGSDGVLCKLRDARLSLDYVVRAKYLFGADGGRSTVARSLGFKFSVAPSFGVACNILINADLGHLMGHREAQLHWIMKPDQRTRFGLAPVLRMVKPWRQWLLVCFTPGTRDDPFRDLTPTSPELTDYIRELIGDDSVDIEVVRLDPWVVRETVADSYSLGDRVHLVGDAAHRHPPAYGLGSNTCIQDAYNLAWKVALVKKGLAGPGLLRTYSDERQPVGADLVRESNDCMDAHFQVWAALGMVAPTAEDGAREIAELASASEAGAARRRRLHEALEGKRREGESLGLTMNQWYDGSAAVYAKDETAPRPALEGDRIVQIQIGTYPGMRLPHAWVYDAARNRQVSTQDLAGHGSFCLFTGHGGEGWKRAAERIAERTGLPLRAYAIGVGLKYHDRYREWHDRRQVGEDGCVLVRPDRFVAWRAQGMVEECERKLLQVLGAILQKDFETLADRTMNGK